MRVHRKIGKMFNFGLAHLPGPFDLAEIYVNLSIKVYVGEYERFNAIVYSPVTAMLNAT